MTVDAAWSAARAELYRYLAAAYLRPPMPPLVAPFLDADVLAGLVARFGPEAVAELAAFRAGFRGDYDALDQEYQDLFTVPLGRYVTPYEAVYRDERLVGGQIVRGLLVGPSTVTITRLYREAGVEVAEELRELPDHVGLELGCMASLCRDEARGWEQGDGAAVRRAQVLERRLLVDHLLVWVPSLCARILDNAAGPFYRGLAALTAAYLAQEDAELAATHAG